MCRPGEGYLYNLGGDGAMDPAWSPDGSWIAFSKLGHITTAAADASDERSLTNDAEYEDRYPQYSQDGSRILFIRLSMESIVSGVASPTELWLMNSDGRDAHKVTDLSFVDTSTGGKGRYVDWTQYLSWYRPHGIEPLEPAAGPSPEPTLFPAPTSIPNRTTFPGE
jgi:dipeptidyl aminopeptidase/acylaminoacyl peptidase